MTAKLSLSILDHFATLSEPRVERTRHHALLDLVVIARWAIISGAESWDDIADYGRRNHDRVPESHCRANSGRGRR